MTTGPRAHLQRCHQLALWQKPLWVLIAALGLDFVFAQSGVDWPVRTWTLGLALVVALSVRLLFRPSLRATACALDSRASSSNRFEALAALAGRTDPLAKAIENETAAHLARRPLPAPYAWFASLALLVALVVLQLATLDLAPKKIVTRPAASVAPPPAIPAKNIPPPPTPMPPASLRWVEPPPGITATAKEIVPLKAESDSPVGLTPPILLLTLAGEPLAPLPQTDRVAAGVQPVSLALDLAKFDGQPFAFVTYHLAAERGRDHVNPGTPPWPAVVSPLQVIQIRPVGSELTLDPPPGDEMAENETERLLFQVKRLKLSQVEVLKSAFALDHEMPSRADAGWPALAQTVTAQERTIWQDTTALIPVFDKTTTAWAALVPLRETLSQIQTAWEELARSDPAAAFASADRGLARIAEVERILTVAVVRLREEKAAAEVAAADESESPLQLPAREDTPAGRLEALARAQQELADQLAQGTATEAFARQDKIARALPKLAAEPVFPPAIASAIAAAAIDAEEATKHLNDRDPRAATEPATRAAQTLQAVLAALEAAGRARGAEVLATTQRELNHAAIETNDGNIAAAESDFVTARQTLREEALRQQQSGSATAAQQLADMSAAMDASKVKAELDQLAKQPQSPAAEERAAVAQKLTQLAQRAAVARQQLLSDEERAKALAQATDELRRAQANVERAAQQGDQAMNDLFEKAQEKAQLTGESLALPPAGNRAVRPGDVKTLPPWKVDTAYAKDDRVSYDGEPFHCLEKHFSRIGLEPPKAPKLWQVEARTGSGGARGASSEEKPSGDFDASKSPRPADAKTLPPWKVDTAYTKDNQASYGGVAFRCLADHISRVGLEPPKAPKLWRVEVQTGSRGGAGNGSNTGGGGGLTDPPNLQRYGRDLSGQISRFVELLAQEQSRIRRTQVLTTATPAEAPPDYRPAVADYFEALARASAKSE
jgi:hypothetical protein